MVPSPVRCVSALAFVMVGCGGTPASVDPAVVAAPEAGLPRGEVPTIAPLPQDLEADNPWANCPPHAWKAGKRIASWSWPPDSSTYDTTITPISASKVLLSGQALYDVDEDTYEILPRPSAYRNGSAVTLLGDEKTVFVAGGGIDAPAWAATSYLDLETKATWPGAALVVPRGGARATLLPTGKILLTGGYAGEKVANPNAELYDPATETSKPVPVPLPAFQWGDPYHRTVSLPDGRVLLVDAHAIALFDPASESWRIVGAMTKNLDFAVGLLDGRVLIGTGWLEDVGYTKVVRHGGGIYDPVTESLTAAARIELAAVSSGLEAEVLACGSVLAWGPCYDGAKEKGLCTLGSMVTVLYDPKRDRWFPLRDAPVLMNWYSSGTRLFDGRVVVAYAKLGLTGDRDFPVTFGSME